MTFLFLIPLAIIQSFSTLQSVEEFIQSMNKEHVLIDVRTPEEFSEGHLPNALNISVTSLNFPFEISKLNKEQTVLVYCRSGKRSARAAMALKAMGFEKIYELRGGYKAWLAAQD